MKTKLHLTFDIRYSASAAFFATLLAAITLFTTPTAPAQTGWGSALSFDGTNDWVQAGSIPLANSSFTVEAWVQRRSSGTMDMVVSQGSAGYNRCLMFGFHYYAGNQFVFDFYGNGVGSGTAETNSNWHHWAATYDASSKIRCLYRDGLLIAWNTNTAPDYQGSGPIKIGVGPGGEAPNEFDGQIDDVRIWNVALSQAQIAAQMTQPLSGKEPNLLAYWKFDEGGGTNTFDATTNHFDGIFKSAPEWVASTPSVSWGHALSVNQSNDYVRTTIPARASNYTVSAWVYLRGGGNYDGGNNVVGLLSATNCNLSAEVMFHSKTSSYMDPQYLELGRCSSFAGLLSTGTVPLNQWVHVAVTVNASKLVSYFINGISAGMWSASGQNVTIGPNITLGDNTVRRFNGMLDEVQIWNVALSQAQIAANMTHPLSGKESNLLAYWKFDEGNGGVAYDATTNHCDGTLVNNPARVVSNVTVPLPFIYTTNNGSIIITKYTGPGWDVTIPDTINGLLVTSIGNSAFYYCTSLTFVAIPDSVTSIGEEAFKSCYSLTGVTIGNSVTTIGDYAFNWCSSLASVVIPDGVTNIGDFAFYGCEGLTNVSLPASVIHVGMVPFLNCSSLMAITVDSNNPAYNSVAGVLFNKDQTMLLEFPAGKTGSYIIPDVVTRISELGFYDCESLSNVTIPDSVTSLGDSAFGNCVGLMGIFFTGNAPSLGGDVFTPDNSATVYYLPGTTGWAAFDAASGLSPAVLWNAQVQTGDASFGIQTDGFGFSISGTADIPIVVEACTNLASSTWTTLQTSTVTNGSLYFCDPEWTNHPTRFYRVRWP